MSNVSVTPTTPPVELSIRSGGKTVLVSGTVHTSDPGQITIQLTDLTFQFQFVKDDKGVRIEPGADKTDKKLPLTLFNFENSIGIGSTTPIPVGTVNERPLSLMLTVYTPTSGANRLIHYTFFLD